MPNARLKATICSNGRWTLSFSLLFPIIALSACAARSPSPEQRIVREALTAIDYCYHWGGEVGDQSEERNKEIADGIAHDCPVAHEKAQRARELYPNNVALAAGVLQLTDIRELVVTDAAKRTICETAAPQFMAALLKSKTEDALFRAECPSQAVRVYGP